MLLFVILLVIVPTHDLVMCKDRLIVIFVLFLLFCVVVLFFDCALLMDRHVTNCPTLLIIVHKDVHNHNDVETRVPRRAVSVSTSSIPEKPPLLATTKSNNYMINAIVALEAERLGGDFGLQIDAESDTILESSVSCVALVNRHGSLVTPTFDRVLPSTTLKRLIDEFVPDLIRRGVIKDFFQRDVPVREVIESKEMFEFGGGWVHPVVSLDNLPIGDGKPGPVFDEICDLMVRELDNERHLDAIPSN